MALGTSTLLISNRGVSPVTGFPALVRWSEGQLYLLDVRTGVIWIARGLEHLGDSEADHAYAQSLLSRARGPFDESNFDFMEAVRYLGCDAVAAYRREK